MCTIGDQRAQLISILQPLVGGEALSCYTREGACRGGICKQCSARHAPGGIFVFIRQIRIESMVKEVMCWAKKIDCDVLVFLSACSYLINITNKCKKKKQKKQCPLASFCEEERWRLVVAGICQHLSSPSLCLCETVKNEKQIHMEENFCSHNFFLCLSKTAPHSGMSSDIYPRRCMLPSWELRNILFLHCVSNIFQETVRPAEQHACQRVSRYLFQNKMSCAS